MNFIVRGRHQWVRRGPSFPGRIVIGVILTALATGLLSSRGQAADPVDAGEIRIVELQGQVEVMPAGASTWVLTQTNQVLQPGDRLRSGLNSRVTLLWSDQSVVPFGQLTEVEILAPENAGTLAGLHVVRGIMSFFHRDKPGRIRVLTHGATASIEGTEFVLQVGENNGVEHSVLSLIDGKVSLSNEQGTLVLTNDEQAEFEPGKTPVRTAGFIANNLLQWCFYYPAVLDPRDLALSADETEALKDSLDSYRAGDLPGALGRYPAGRQAASDDERIYHAALLLAVGQVGQTESELAMLPAGDPGLRTQRLARALRTLIAAVKRQGAPAGPGPQMATELLAASYYEQSRAGGDATLGAALELARRAAAASPEFGFAWSRMAELEFGFGRAARAREALDTGLRLAPRNAEALALKGFVLAAQGNVRGAIGWFNRALAADSALGNAWLGRGLCRIRLGDGAGGRKDLLVAAALEPQRAVLRSYLGKAYADAGDDIHANRELALARKLDPADPTSWLYAALLHQEENRVNEAIRDLEKSEELNDNRSLYRSKLLLDEDSAVRGANLAGIYADAGMDDVSTREATRAVNEDYANYSAHLFLANSYNQLRDPQQIDLRYETPWLSEFLVANLLAPVGAGTLSQTVSQQEYGKLFEQDRVGLVSSTDYLSRGQWTESGSQYGNIGNFGYALDGFFLSDTGQRPNEEQQQLTLSAQLKWDVTAQDSLFAQVIGYHSAAGDLTQYYNQNQADQGLWTIEKQEPQVLVGGRHEWSPGLQTLVLAGRFTDDYSVNNSEQPVLWLLKDTTGQVFGVPTPSLPTTTLDYRSRLEIYSTELQQIWETDPLTTVFGARYQVGDFDTQSALGPSGVARFMNGSMITPSFLHFSSPAISESERTDFQRMSGYGYGDWRVFEALQVTAGVSYDALVYPQDFRAPPISGPANSERQISPKAGFTWTPWRNTAVRFAYTKSLGGVSFDQSVRLEPVQVDGFTQAFRSLIPEAVAGSTAGAKFETYGLALEQKLPTGTYFTVEGDLYKSDANQIIGDVDQPLAGILPLAPVASATQQNLDYHERDVTVTLDQLVGDFCTLGAQYELSQAELDTDYPSIPATVTTGNDTRNNATENQVMLFAVVNHPSGFFARAEGVWYSQRNGGYTPTLTGDDFWQVNLFAGWRLLHRKLQAEAGVLNVGNSDYDLNPLNLYNELPRRRTVALSLQFNL
jgi:Tfp pilus assembly protein PilF